MQNRQHDSHMDLQQLHQQQQSHGSPDQQRQRRQTSPPYFTSASIPIGGTGGVITPNRPALRVVINNPTHMAAPGTSPPMYVAAATSPIAAMTPTPFDSLGLSPTVPRRTTGTQWMSYQPASPTASSYTHSHTRQQPEYGQPSSPSNAPFLPPMTPPSAPVFRSTSYQPMSPIAAFTDFPPSLASPTLATSPQQAMSPIAFQAASPPFHIFQPPPSSPPPHHTPSPAVPAQPTTPTGDGETSHRPGSPLSTFFMDAQQSPTPASASTSSSSSVIDIDVDDTLSSAQVHSPPSTLPPQSPSLSSTPPTPSQSSSKRPLPPPLSSSPLSQSTEDIMEEAMASTAASLLQAECAITRRGKDSFRDMSLFHFLGHPVYFHSPSKRDLVMALVFVLLWWLIAMCHVRFWLACSFAFAILNMWREVRFIVFSRGKVVFRFLRYILSKYIFVMSILFVVSLFSFAMDPLLIPEFRDHIVKKLSRRTLMVLFYSKRLGMVDKVLPVLLSVYIVSFFIRHRNIYERTNHLLKALITAAFITGCVKFALHRQRPAAELGFLAFRGPSLGWEGNGNKDLSFPSGHSSTAFAMATIAWHLFPDIKWFGLSMWLLSFVNGITRFLDTNHWLSDVVGGGAVGYLVALFYLFVRQQMIAAALPQYRHQLRRAHQGEI
eukprot:TRINITY_DN4162_c0_g1_i1.p1 TRINITY_DN4162_c0_g1~~TRINITY_DN4162_c0_g1_i1.p1  ORF type:complete len:703 (-),score=182.37 TRINITY_DN4162_c0_g1_i1:40-2025(-)